MGNRLLRSVCAVVLVWCSSASASASTIDFAEGFFNRAWFGADGFFYEGEPAVFPGNPTGYRFSTGPALVVQPNAGGGFDFEFGEGLLEIFQGTTALATIPVEPFNVSVSGQYREPINATYFPPGQLVADYIDVTVSLLPGHLDPQLASILGVSPLTLGGHLNMVVDDPLLTSGTPDVCSGAPWDVPPVGPPLYCGVPNDIVAQVEVQAVPEPSLLGLLGLGVGISIPVLKRARRTRRS